MLGKRYLFFVFPILFFFSSFQVIALENDPAEDIDLPSAKPPPIQKGLLVAETRVSISRLDVSANGSGSFASGISPGLALIGAYPLSSEINAVVRGGTDYVRYHTSSASGSFDAPSPWFWFASAGANFRLQPRFHLTSGFGIGRRIFIYRESPTALGGDPGIIPEFDLGAIVQLPRVLNGRMRAGVSAAYLFPVATSYAVARSGIALRAEVKWEPPIRKIPFTFGISAERDYQNTSLGDHSVWILTALIDFALITPHWEL